MRHANGQSGCEESWSRNENMYTSCKRPNESDRFSPSSSTDDALTLSAVCTGQWQEKEGRNTAGMKKARQNGPVDYQAMSNSLAQELYVHHHRGSVCTIK